VVGFTEPFRIGEEGPRLWDSSPGTRGGAHVCGYLLQGVNGWPSRERNELGVAEGRLPETGG